MMLWCNLPALAITCNKDNIKPSKLASIYAHINIMSYTIIYIVNVITSICIIIFINLLRLEEVQWFVLDC